MWSKLRFSCIRKTTCLIGVVVCVSLNPGVKTTGLEEVEGFGGFGLDDRTGLPDPTPEAAVDVVPPPVHAVNRTSAARRAPRTRGAERRRAGMWLQSVEGRFRTARDNRVETVRYVAGAARARSTGAGWP